MGNKNVRKLAGTAASVGGMALLGGLAAKAIQNWQNPPLSNKSDSSTSLTEINNKTCGTDDFKLTLIKAMVAAAKSDGHIDSIEQEKIFRQSENLALSSEEKAFLFDLISRPIEIEEICSNLKTVEQKAEIYLASKIVCQDLSLEESKHLANLAEGLELPKDLIKNLDQQASAG
jgi:uncharacterized membrane protein YebE (DUF533 family)